MDVPTWVWWTTIVVTMAVLLFDVAIVGRRPHEPSMKEVSAYLSVYVGMAVLFGIGVWIFSGSQFGGEFFAGWLTEYSLSVDNLFIFIIILSKFAVPKEYQQTALMVGIVLALVLRAVFIAVGAAAINQFSWVFYLFGAFLIYTAIKLFKEAREDDEDGDYEEPRIVRWAERNLPATKDYHGAKIWVKENGKRLVTPMFIVMLALGMTASTAAAVVHAATTAEQRIVTGSVGTLAARVRAAGLRSPSLIVIGSVVNLHSLLMLRPETALQRDGLPA